MAVRAPTYTAPALHRICSSETISITPPVRMMNAVSPCVTPSSMMSALRLGRYSAAIVPMNCSTTTTPSGPLYGARWVRRILSSMSVVLSRMCTDAVEQGVRNLLWGQQLVVRHPRMPGAEHQRPEQQGGGRRLHTELVLVVLEALTEHFQDGVVGVANELRRTVTRVVPALALLGHPDGTQRDHQGHHSLGASGQPLSGDEHLLAQGGQTLQGRGQLPSRGRGIHRLLRRREQQRRF